MKRSQSLLLNIVRYAQIGMMSIPTRKSHRPSKEIALKLRGPVHPTCPRNARISRGCGLPTNRCCVCRHKFILLSPPPLLSFFSSSFSTQFLPPTLISASPDQINRSFTLSACEQVDMLFVSHPPLSLHSRRRPLLSPVPPPPTPPILTVSLRIGNLSPPSFPALGINSWNLLTVPFTSFLLWPSFTCSFYSSLNSVCSKCIFQWWQKRNIWDGNLSPRIHTYSSLLPVILSSLRGLIRWVDQIVFLDCSRFAEVIALKERYLRDADDVIYWSQIWLQDDLSLRFAGSNLVHLSVGQH